MAINPSLQLSRIHRLIRPLKASITSLLLSLDELSVRTRSNELLQKKNHPHHFYAQPRANKQSIEDEREFTIHPSSSTHPHRQRHPHRHPHRSRHLRKYPHRRPTRPSNRSLPKPRTTNPGLAINPISSPVFSGHPHRSPLKLKLNPNSSSASSSSLRARSNFFHLIHPVDHPDEIELEIQIKIDKILLAYKNILDVTSADPSSPSSSQPSSSSYRLRPPDKLSTICARVIGHFIEHAINQEILDRHKERDHHPSDPSPLQSHPSSLFDELDWKTSVMDEWYDAIPPLYRRYALAQHALTMILLNFPLRPNSIFNPTNRSSSSSIPINSATIIPFYSQKLFQAIHTLHRSYNSPSIQAQANLILENLLRLPSAAWFEIYDDYHHKFNLADQFSSQFRLIVGDRSFLEFCSDPELVGFIDLTIGRFGTWAIERWLDQRESLIQARNRWRSAQAARQAGLESSDSDPEQALNDEMIIEYDKQTSSILIKWIDSLVINCLPNSIDCQPARVQLNSISRLLFDSLSTYSNHPERCSKEDNYFLSLLSITVESHRLALFSLPMFNTASVDLPGLSPEWSSPHTPMRLQALIPKVITHLDQSLFNKAAKLFLRAHRSTRLLAVLPGLLSTRHQAIIPGLDRLLRSLVDGDYSLEFVGKTWVECLLQTDPTSWWMRADNNLGDDDDDNHVSNNGAQDVRSWLETWLTILDDAEKLRLNLYDPQPQEDHLYNQNHQPSDDGEQEDQEEETEENDDDEDDDDPNQVNDQQSLTLADNGVLDQVLPPPLDDIKPELIQCTCPNQNPLSQLPLQRAAIEQGDEDKPIINEQDHEQRSLNPSSSRTNATTNPTTGTTTTTGTTRSTFPTNTRSTTTSQVRVIVPVKKRRRKTPLLSLPSSRSKRKKSMTPRPSLSSSTNLHSNLTPSNLTEGTMVIASTEQRSKNDIEILGVLSRRGRNRFDSLNSRRSTTSNQSIGLITSTTYSRSNRSQSVSLNPLDHRMEEDEDEEDDFDVMDLLSHRARSQSSLSHHHPI